jgi:hypothetical protein
MADQGGRPMTAQVARLPGGRLHLHHGPIDIVLKAWGEAGEVAVAYDRAVRRFMPILDELVDELAQLRQPTGPAHPLLRRPVARRMAGATAPFADRFITPMAAVAGSVADEVMAALAMGASIDKAYVNNGGDIALHLAPGERLKAGIVDDQDAPSLDADVEIESAMPVRGLATSGWRGRSFSLGIADAVTVLARDAATADAAATLIANAVDVDHEAVIKRPASSLRDDTDLGDRLVTVEVGPLPEAAIVSSMNAGVARAKEFRARGLIHSAYLSLQNRRRVVAHNSFTLSAGASA